MNIRIGKVFTGVLGLLALAAGGMIYMLYRTREMLVFRLTDYLGISSWIHRMREHAPVLSVPEWVIYSLPGGLWTAAYILIMDAITHRWTQKRRLLWTMSIPMMGVASEILQALGWLPGTFDIIDALCYVLPYAIYLCHTCRSESQKNRRSQLPNFKMSHI